MSYIVAIPSREASGEFYQRTIRSLEAQSLKPREIFVCLHSSSKFERVGKETPLYLDEKINPSFTRVPKLVNLALPKRLPSENLFISGDDSEYEPRYAEALHKELFSDVGVISGVKIERGERNEAQAPEGSGRLINSTLCKRALPFPTDITWESGLLQDAQFYGFKTRVVHSVAFNHLRPLGKHSIRTFGHAAHMLGYPFTYTIFRVLTILIDRNNMQKKDALQILVGHAEANLLRYPKVKSAEAMNRIVQRKLIFLYFDIAHKFTFPLRRFLKDKSDYLQSLWNLYEMPLASSTKERKVLFVHDCAFTCHDLIPYLKEYGYESESLDINDYKNVFDLAQAIRRSDAGIIHANYIRDPAFACFLSRKKPYLLHAHGDDIRYGLSILQRLAIRGASKVFYSTEDLKGIIKGSIQLPQPVDMNRFHPTMLGKKKAVYFRQTTSNIRLTKTEPEFISEIKEQCRETGYELTIVPSMTHVPYDEMPAFLSSFEILFDKEKPQGVLSKTAREAYSMGLQVVKDGKLVRIEIDKHDARTIAADLAKQYDEILGEQTILVQVVVK